MHTLSDADIALFSAAADRAYRAGDMARGHAFWDAVEAGEVSPTVYGMLQWQLAHEVDA